MTQNRPIPVRNETRPRARRAVLFLMIAGLVALFGAGAEASASENERSSKNERSEIEELKRRLAEKDALIVKLQAEASRNRARPPATPADPRVTPADVLGPVGVEVVNDAPPPAEAVSVPEAAVDFSEGGTAERPWLESVSIFAGIDGSKQPQDFGANAHLGGRFALNWAFPIVKELGIGAQVGSSINFHNNAVQVFERVQGNSTRTQSFTTVGLFQRTDSGLTWAVGYDFLYQDYFDQFHLGQWRGRVGQQFGENDELGLNVMISNTRDVGYFGSIRTVLDPITQGNLYWTHTWATGAATTAWIGVADSHGQANVALGDLAPINNPFLFGAQVDIPLNERLSLFGQANFIRPADTGTVDAFLGFRYTPFARTSEARTRRFDPVLPVANNTTFSTDLTRRPAN